MYQIQFYFGGEWKLWGHRASEDEANEVAADVAFRKGHPAKIVKHGSLDWIF
jgi:hypothetical protein